MVQDTRFDVDRVCYDENTPSQYYSLVVMGKTYVFSPCSYTKKLIR